MILNLIICHGRERCRYDETISSCNFWCMTVVGDMEAEVYVAGGAAEHFTREITMFKNLNPHNSASSKVKWEFSVDLKIEYALRTLVE